LSTAIFVPFGGNVEEFLVREVGAFEFAMDGRVVDGDETIRLQEVEKLVQKPVWVSVWQG
jgi:hypothetical protein